MLRCFLLMVCFLLAASDSLPAEEVQPLTRIAFGSCVRQTNPQPIWDSVVAFKPQAFLFIGDNIYGDTEDMDLLRAKYKQLGDNPGYRRLLKTCPLYAVWDDHDYGVNDGGAEYPKKVESQRVFNDFFQTPADSPRRKRPGVYDSLIVGPPGQRVQILLLDTRYFRSPLKRKPEGERQGGPYGPNPDASTTVLGEAQWKWLQEQLETPAEVRIFASSIQVVPDEHGWEKWGNFPHERERLFRLIGETKAKGVIILSGDRHRAEINVVNKTAAGYPLYDITSSSLNAPSAPHTGEPSSYRLGEQITGVNFGSVVIDWEKKSVAMAVYDGEGKTVLKQSATFADLKIK